MKLYCLLENFSNLNVQAFARSPMQVFVGYPSGPSVIAQAVRIGAPGPLTATITSSASGVFGLLSAADTSVGAGVATVQIPAGQQSTSSNPASPQYLNAIGKAVGTSAVNVSIPGYITPVAFPTTITVTSPTISSSAFTVGAGLQVVKSASLSTSFHGGKTVTITSTDPAKLLLAPNDSTPGAASITVNVPDRQSSFTWYLQGVEAQFGGVPVTISAPGYTTATVRDSVATPVVEITSALGSATISSSDRPFTVRVGLPNSSSAPTSLVALQGVRWNAATPTPLVVSAVLTPIGANASLLVTTGSTGLTNTVQLLPRLSTSASTVAAGGIAWRPGTAAATTATISVSAPGFLVTPATSTRTLTIP